MGILQPDASVIETLIRDGHLVRGFSVCELGNQIYRVGGGKTPSPEWYRSLGAGHYASIDANGQADCFADLNLPLPDDLRSVLGQFDLVTDFGTGEHIFNQAEVWQTLHDLCRPRGYIVLHRPAQGWRDHCFYNIHPTLIVDLAAANGYEVLRLDEREERHGTLLMASLRKGEDAPFRYPNQGKYKAMLAAAPSASAARIKRGDVLIALASQNGWRSGAEIGVLNGEAVFFPLLNACSELTMIAVDEWSETDKDYGDLSAVGEAFRERARLPSYRERAHVIHGRSIIAAAQVPDASLDFVFIDASHDYESVRADITAWTLKVKPGGMVLGHDWNPERFPGVIRALREAFGQPELFHDHVWGVRV